MTVAKCDTRRTNRTDATITPTTTPIARFEVITTSATVEIMTNVSLFGMRRSVDGRMLCQSNVATHTMIITATSAAIGMIATTSPRVTTSTSRNTPAQNVEMRVRAPETLTLIMVWPIIAQPPMPPRKPESMFATPWPHASRVLCEWVSVISSTSFAVMRDSSSPTSAIPSENGAMIVKVSQVSGMFGRKSSGRLRGSSPSSPTVGTSSANTTTTAVTRMIETSGAGTTFVRRGISTMMIRPPATSGYTSHGTSIRCGSWAMKTRIASALTNPTMTLRGMNRMSFATPRTARSTWKTPARITVAMK